MKRVVIFFICALLTTVGFNGTALAASDKVLPQFMFNDIQNPDALVAEKLASAKAKNKLLLVVFGAEWCHDSKGLAAKFSSDLLLPKLESKYEMAFVDVGYLEKGFELIQQFEQAIYYGTPTVLIIDPVTKQVLNKADLKRWTSATAHNMAEYQDYFIETDFRQNSSQTVDLKNYEQPIREFEAKQAKRLREAYEILGPLLFQYKHDKKASRSEFNYKWRQVWNFRTKVPDDIEALIKQAQANLKKGKSTPLNYPSYPKFSWES